MEVLKADKPKTQYRVLEDQEMTELTNIDNLILDLVHQGSMLRAGKTTMLKASPDKKLVKDTLIDFMEAIQEWSSMVEGSPSDKEMKELDKIYAMTEVELKFTINNEAVESDNGTELDTNAELRGELVK